MDRQRRFIIAFWAAVACLATGVLAQSGLGLREAGWLSERGRIEALTTEPVFDRDQLLAAAIEGRLGARYASHEDLRRDLLIGEFLFKTPLLLGGQAAKAGISCHSCHVNGRGNPHFQFPAISGDRGTADTTHSFFSETLGNGVFDPVTIPDLTRAGKVSHHSDRKDLERFIEKIVGEEFAGRKPTEELIRPIATFVRALRMSGLAESGKRQNRSAERDWHDASLMVQQAARLTSDDDREVSRLLLSGARDRMAIIHERLLQGDHESARGWLVTQSRGLGSIQAMLRQESASSERLAEMFAAWEEAAKSAPDFIELESESLYDPTLLADYSGG